MNRYWAQAVLWGALLVPVGHAMAQDASADVVIQSALKVLSQLDTQQAAAALDGAAPLLKARGPAAELVQQLQAARQEVGPVAQRLWASVNRLQVAPTAATAQLPEGIYGNVDFTTQLADGRVVAERISLRLEADGAWRLVGYVPRTR